MPSLHRRKELTPMLETTTQPTRTVPAKQVEEISFPTFQGIRYGRTEIYQTLLDNAAISKSPLLCIYVRMGPVLV